MATSADVTLKVAQAEAIASLNQFAATFERMNKRMESSIRGNATASKEVSAAIGGWRKHVDDAFDGVTRMTIALVGARSIAQQIRKEFELKQEIEQKSVATSQAYSVALQELSWQWPRLGDDKFPLEKAEQMIRESKIADKAVAARIVKASVSAGLGLSKEERTNVALRLGEMMPGMQQDPEGLAELAGTVVVQARTWQQSPEASLGMTVAALSASRPVSMKSYAANIAPLSFDLKPFGFTQQEALAIGSAYSTAIEDVEGETTRTNVYTFIAQLFSEMRDSKRLDVREKAHGMKMFDFIRSDDPEAERLRNKLAGKMRRDLTAEELGDEEFMSVMGDIDSGKPLGDLMGRLKGKSAWYAFLTRLSEMEDLPESFANLLKVSLLEMPVDSPAAEGLTRTIESENARNPANLMSLMDVVFGDFKSSRDISSVDKNANRKIIDFQKEFYGRIGNRMTPALKAWWEGERRVLSQQLEGGTLNAVDYLAIFQDQVRQEQLRHLTDYKGPRDLRFGKRFELATGQSLESATPEDWRRFHELDQDWSRSDWELQTDFEKLIDGLDLILANLGEYDENRYQGATANIIEEEDLRQQKIRQEEQTKRLQQQMIEQGVDRVEDVQETQREKWERMSGKQLPQNNQTPIPVEIMNIGGIHQTMKPKPEQPAAADLGQRSFGGGKGFW